MWAPYGVATYNMVNRRLVLVGRLRLHQTIVLVRCISQYIGYILRRVLVRQTAKQVDNQTTGLPNGFSLMSVRLEYQ
jgi:hypothetical protein